MRNEKERETRKVNECKKSTSVPCSSISHHFLFVFLVVVLSLFVCFTFEREGRRIKTAVLVVFKKREREKKGNSWLVSSGVFEVVSSSKRTKSIAFPLEGEPEAVADVDPDDLEDALAGHELDEQDAEEAHLGVVVVIFFRWSA